MRCVVFVHAAVGRSDDFAGCWERVEHWSARSERCRFLCTSMYSNGHNTIIYLWISLKNIFYKEKLNKKKKIKSNQRRLGYVLVNS